MLPRLGRPAFLGPLAILVVFIAVGAWLWTRAGSSTPMSEADALAWYGSGGDGATGGPEPGVWTYRVTGDETVGVGPLKVDRALPAEGRIVVRPAADGYWRTLALSEEHVEATRFEVTPHGSYARERRTIVTVAGIGRDDLVMLKPPPLSYPAVIRVGRTWDEEYMLDEIRVRADVRVLRREVVRVGDRDVPAFVIRTVSDITGPLPGERTDVQWWAPGLRMPVRWILDMRISGVASLETHADMVLAEPGPSA